MQTLLDGPHLIRAYIDSGGKIIEIIRDASVVSDEINLTGWRDSERRFTLVSLSPKCTLQNVIQEELTL